MDIDRLTLGVEEEYLVVDPLTRKAAANPPRSFFKTCQDALGSFVTPEFLRCQIEIATPVCADVTEARDHLSHMRGTIAKIAKDHDLALMAASTHPFTDWRDQKPTAKKRYRDLEKDLQGAIRRMLICGTHIHVGIMEPDVRIDVMNQMRYFLPHMLALSTSSPFWEGDIMGMKSYRLSVFDGMPRTGIPGPLHSFGEFERTLDVLAAAGVMEDGSKIWWDIRPSMRFPTLESRITDMCTRLEDTLAIVAIYQCLTRMFLHLRQRNIKWRTYPSFLISENRWLAQRFGVQAKLVDFGAGIAKPMPDLIEELINFLMQHAQALGCERELLHARTIAERGSSACRQVATYDAAIGKGAKKQDALNAVVDMLVEETVMGI